MPMQLPPIRSVSFIATDEVFSDIMNLTECDRFSDSRVIPQQVKTRSGVYLVHGEIGIGGN